MPIKKERWSHTIQPKTSVFQIDVGILWQYKDLLAMLIKKDFIFHYKQTILGPIWVFLQPILTTAIFIIVFNNIAKIGTDGVPAVLFYLSGLTLWSYFSDTITKTSTTFKDNANLFSKVYFPRLIIPISITISQLIKLGIQMLLFFIIWLVYAYTHTIEYNYYILFTPLIVLVLALQALSIGLIISSITSKYRDLIFALTFFMQLWMYATPIIYPLSFVSEKYRYLLNMNPISPMIEVFRYAFLGQGYFTIFSVLYSIIFTLIALIIGLLIFNKTEKTVIDTI